MISTYLKYVTGCGTYIQDFCKKESINFDELADLVNKDRHTIRKWTSNKLGVSPGDLNRMCELFGEDFEELIRERIKALERQKRNSDMGVSANRPDPKVHLTVDNTTKQEQNKSEPKQTPDSQTEQMAANQTPEEPVKKEAAAQETAKPTSSVKRPILSASPAWNFAVKFITWLEETGAEGISSYLEKGEAECRSMYEEKVSFSEYIPGEIVKILPDKAGLIVKNEKDSVDILINTEVKSFSKEEVRHTGKRYDASL